MSKSSVKVDEQHSTAFGDCRDRLRNNCPRCSSELANAEVDQQGVAGPTAYGEYACGSKFITWAIGSEAPICIRLCNQKKKKAGKVALLESERK